jgi:hypothetical protein
VSPKALPAEAGIQRGDALLPAASPGLPTGFAALDALLPGGGWPVGALTEILPDREGIGEVRLLLPALAALSRQGRWLAWIDPPHIPYAPALSGAGVDLSRMVLVQPRRPEEALWAAEQALASGAPAAVLMWLKGLGGHPGLGDRPLRRLQLAAERGRSWGVLFRPPEAAGRPSPATLRMTVNPAEAGVAVQVVKCRGAAAGRPAITLPLTGP